MNALSWLLYAAEVFDRVADLLRGLLLIGGTLAALAQVVLVLLQEELTALPRWRLIVTSLVALGFVLLIIPSRQTVYLIAASELAERAAASPDGRQMIDLLKSRVRGALESEGARP